ncbi:MAG TPA: hypothetical protein VD995_23295 [Azospirillum sp.]|nr:hypothetical protein [Azospirillum sp.]
MAENDWLRLVGLLMVMIIVVPGVLALNRHTWLRNTAIWLAVLAALVFLYQTFGPL